jgi:DNA helicase-2/ATP-dependent DNA helicase PcrA
MMDISDQKQELLKTCGNLLILGGPGSGKTTIALLKAKRVIEEEGLKFSQSVLFLSFARATISRVEQRSGTLRIPKNTRRQLDIETYHGFAWRIIKSHGYLLKAHPKLRLLPPPEAASRLASIKEQAKKEEEKQRLFEEEGLIHFDLFAALCVKLLSASTSLLKILCDAYPLIILDEFQDTNSNEWQLISLLGKHSQLIALADPEQRIYEFRGADPERVREFVVAFKPTQFDFGLENNRSVGTDINQFGTDILTGANKGKIYKNVECVEYAFRKGTGTHLHLKCQVFKSYKRLKESGLCDWSIAVLVPTKRLMLGVSDYLSSKQTFPNNRSLPSLSHEVALETEGPSLAAIVIARLLEVNADGNPIGLFISDLYEHIRGRHGADGPNKSDLTFSDALKMFVETGKIKGSRRSLTIEESKRIVSECKAMELSGDPAVDWKTIRSLLLNAQCEFIRQIGIDAQYLRLLHKGSLLMSALSGLFRKQDNYYGAANAVRAALLQEHFASSTNTWKGVHVMTIHKAKGKEFDEVIVYEGFRQGKIVRPNATKREIEQSRYKLRVAVTRARNQATILTPTLEKCVFL